MTKVMMMTTEGREETAKRQNPTNLLLAKERLSQCLCVCLSSNGAANLLLLLIFLFKCLCLCQRQSLFFSRMMIILMMMILSPRRWLWSLCIEKMERLDDRDEGTQCGKKGRKEGRGGIQDTWDDFVDPRLSLKEQKRIDWTKPVCANLLLFSIQGKSLSLSLSLSPPVTSGFPFLSRSWRKSRKHFFFFFPQTASLQKFTCGSSSLRCTRIQKEWKWETIKNPVPTLRDFDLHPFLPSFLPSPLLLSCERHISQASKWVREADFEGEEEWKTPWHEL